jgi:hypothetical protein
MHYPKTPLFLLPETLTVAEFADEFQIKDKVALSVAVSNWGVGLGLKRTPGKKGRPSKVVDTFALIARINIADLGRGRPARWCAKCRTIQSHNERGVGAYCKRCNAESSSALNKAKNSRARYSRESSFVASIRVILDWAAIKHEAEVIIPNSLRRVDLLVHTPTGPIAVECKKWTEISTNVDQAVGQAIVSAVALGATPAVCFPSGCGIDSVVADACAAYGILIFTEHSLVAYATGK